MSGCCGKRPGRGARGDWYGGRATYFPQQVVLRGLPNCIAGYGPISGRRPHQLRAISRVRVSGRGDQRVARIRPHTPLPSPLRAHLILSREGHHLTTSVHHVSRQYGRSANLSVFHIVKPPISTGHHCPEMWDSPR